MRDARPSKPTRTALKVPSIASIWPRVTLRPLFAILIAFAMLFAPLAMQSGAAMAAMPSDHHSQMMEKGHCGEQPAKGTDSKSTDMSCCVAMCTAIAMAPASVVEPFAYSRGIDRPAIDQLGRSFLAELPTPPPRRA
jgi:hypothetical protein